MEALGTLHELDQEDGRDLGEDDEEVEAKEDRDDQDQDEGPCCCVGAAPAPDCVGGVVVFDAHDDDHEGENAGCDEVEREGAVDEDHEEPPDHHDEPLPDGLGCEGRACEGCCELELVAVVAPVGANGGVTDEFEADAERGGN